jgi:hypothetical protein
MTRARPSQVEVAAWPVIDVSESIASIGFQRQRCQWDIGARECRTLLILRRHCAALTPTDIDLSPLIANEFR